ncbi:S-adenosyl-L-methionine-dependent methyltransferase [Lasiosphaeria hispida]|uniref:S-adenosyl-L-methionine-dependent methyltransferase n=1 Tax=Lasiosphaeria hispida TaxID=260671 RepID=A0AAJ0HC57_9PEZI|nr:S-adenosyl-L-methionine-dependent methyltransferase [Lasiosphaeria hispida]
MAEHPIEVDVGEGDRDSVIEDRLTTYTASLSPSVLDYPFEHGRRYHALRPGVYAMPNDEKEIDRLDLTHHMMVKGIGNKLFFAPIDKEGVKVQRILDIGTGTGIWAIEIGDVFPCAEILGNDLSAIQPQWVPPNVKFEVDDVESEWTHSAPFDYIFCRYMFACILNWPKLVKNVYDNLAPGGWAEFQDFDLLYYSEDGSLTDDHHTLKWLKALLPLADKIGREPCPGPKQEKWVRDAGFREVTVQKFRFPLGPWAKDPLLKEVGMCNLAQVLEGLEAFSLRLFCDVGKWDEKEVLLLLSKVRKEVKDPNIHMQFDFYVTIGQKPE